MLQAMCFGIPYPNIRALEYLQKTGLVISAGFCLNFAQDQTRFFDRENLTGKFDTIQIKSGSGSNQVKYGSKGIEYGIAQVTRPVLLIGMLKYYRVKQVLEAEMVRLFSVLEQVLFRLVLYLWKVTVQNVVVIVRLTKTDVAPQVPQLVWVVVLLPQAT